MFFDFAYICVGLIAAWLVVVSVRTCWRDHCQTRSFRKRALSSRPAQEVLSMYRDDVRSVGLDPDDFCHSWTRLAEVLSVEPGQLRPADRFSLELALPKPLWWFDPAQDLWLDAIEMCRKNGREFPSQIDTVADFVWNTTKLRARS